MDITAPVIVLSGDANVSHPAMVAYEDQGASWTDLVDGSGEASVTGSVDITTPGNYTLVYSATDTSGNVAGEVTRLVRIIDSESPIITMRGESTITHEAGTVYTDEGAYWNDSVDGSGNALAEGFVNSSLPGTYQIIYRFTDNNNNIAENVTRTINVVDSTAPVIALNDDSNITHEAGTAYLDVNATWTDAVDGQGIVYGSGDVNVSKPGIYYLTFDYTDLAGNAAETVTRTINVVDSTAPVIALNGDSNITHEAGTAYLDANATWTDAVDGEGIVYGVGDVNISKPGIYYLTFDYTDDAGNAAQTVTRTVNVVDTTAPRISLNGNPYITHEAGTAYLDINATWTDAVDGSGIINAQGEVDTSIPGIYYLTFNFTDDAGNVAQTVTRTVNVVDTTAPVIALNGDSNITHEAGTAYLDVNATWTDAVDGQGIVYGFGDVNVSKPGIYYLTFDYNDLAGNAAQNVTRTINVVDSTVPVITLNGDSNITHEAGTAYHDANATWTDAVDGEGVVYGGGDVNVSKPGIYYLTFNYTDVAGNVAQTISRTVNVVDSTAPVISLRGSRNVSQWIGSSYSESGATWYDAVDGEGEAQVTGDVLTDILGTYELIYSHTDQAGNHAVTVKRIVQVLNTLPTELVSQSPLSVLENQPIGTFVGTFTSRSDNINSKLAYRLVDDGSSKDSFFTLDENGTLRTASVFDFEMGAKQFEIIVEVADQFGASHSERFTVDLLNIVEDLDDDGIEDAYDEDIDGDGFTNETEATEGTDPHDPYSLTMQPLLKTSSESFDDNGSIILRGRVEADGGGKITDVGFVLSSNASFSSASGDNIWLRGEGDANNFYLKVEDNPFEGYFYYRAWAKNVAGYGIGSLKKVVLREESNGWLGVVDDLEGGWKKSSWFGTFRVYEDGWLYHARLGWLYNKEAPSRVCGSGRNRGAGYGPRRKFGLICGLTEPVIGSTCSPLKQVNQFIFSIRQRAQLNH